MSASGDLPDTPPVPAADETARRGRFGRPHRLALLGALAVVVALIAGIVLLTRDSSPPPINQAQASKIASDAVKKGIDDLEVQARRRLRPPTSRSCLRSSRSRPTGQSDEGELSGLGAGVIVNKSGTILTALHVVAGANSVRVSFVDGTKSPATVTSTEPENDIAVLQPDRLPEVIVPAVLGSAGQVGDEAFAVGHPLGYVGSLTVRRHLRASTASITVEGRQEAPAA